MARVHLSKRTVIPRYNKDLEQATSTTSEVKTYYLSAEELEKYQNMPVTSYRRPIIPHKIR